MALEIQLRRGRRSVQPATSVSPRVPRATGGAVRGGHGGLPPCGEVRRGKAPSETITKAETNIENTELNSHNRINFGDSIQDKLICFKFGMLFFGHVIAQYSMRRGFAPSPFPTAGTTFPLDTLLFNASLFSFTRGQLYSMAILHVSPRIYCRAQANLWLALHRNKCVCHN